MVHQARIYCYISCGEIEWIWLWEPTNTSGDETDTEKQDGGPSHGPREHLGISEVSSFYRKKDIMHCKSSQSNTQKRVESILSLLRPIHNCLYLVMPRLVHASVLYGYVCPCIWAVCMEIVEPCPFHPRVNSGELCDNNLLPGAAVLETTP